MAEATPPDSAREQLRLGNAHASQGRFDDAVAAYRAAISIHPDYALAHCNLGAALHGLGDLDHAVAECRAALRIQPDLVIAHINLAAALKEQGKLDEAAAACRAAIALDPSYAPAHYNLGTLLVELRDFEAAAAELRRAVQLEPAMVDAHWNLGLALQKRGRVQDAGDAFRAAIAIRPDLAKVHNGLGMSLKEQARLDEAFVCFRRAMALSHVDDEDATVAHDNLIYDMHFHPGCGLSMIREEHGRWNDRHAEPLKRFIRPHNNSRDPDRRLKVGYVSPDFYKQAESFFVVPLLEAHDRREIEIHCYASVERPDQMTARIQKCAGAWHEVRPLNDGQLAERIRADGIDILVDLTMHMARNRLRTFARKPAPVQVTWLAYPGSSGLETMDYRLTDAHMDPPGSDQSWSSEEAVRLPDSWCCYDPLREDVSADVSEALPARSAGCVTFGSLNNFCKVNEPVLARWAHVLAAVSGSRFALLCPEGDARSHVLSFFRSRGIEERRILFAYYLTRRDYLRVYNQIDIALDPFPYNGITTTCDALWMGVPVLTMPGNVPASRAGLSLLTTAGLPEFIARSEDDYVRLAADLANDLPRLQELRSTLRTRVEASPLMDAPRFARAVEQAYRQMWRRWCARR